MNEIKVAENKTLKLTNVVARRIAPEELGNMMVALTQLQNFIKSHNAQPIGPLVQALKIGPAPEHAPELYLMQQATQLITQTEPGYEVDAVLRVKNCLYAHYTGPMAYSQLASSKLQIIEVLDGRCHSYLVSINTSTTASSSSWLTKMV